MRITAPGTRPPPRTRSSSPIPVGRARALSTSISVIGRAGLRVGGVTAVRGPVAATASSTTVPQAWHSPHRPTHFAAVQPHSAQAKPGRDGRGVPRGGLVRELGRVEGLATHGTLSVPSDTVADARPGGGRP